MGNLAPDSDGAECAADHFYPGGNHGIAITNPDRVNANLRGFTEEKTGAATVEIVAEPTLA